MLFLRRLLLLRFSDADIIIIVGFRKSGVCITFFLLLSDATGVNNVMVSDQLMKPFEKMMIKYINVALIIYFYGIILGTPA